MWRSPWPAAVNRPHPERRQTRLRERPERSSHDPQGGRTAANGSCRSVRNNPLPDQPSVGARRWNRVAITTHSLITDVVSCEPLARTHADSSRPRQCWPQTNCLQSYQPLPAHHLRDRRSDSSLHPSDWMQSDRERRTARGTTQIKIPHLRGWRACDGLMEQEATEITEASSLFSLSALFPKGVHHASAVLASRWNDS